MKEHTANIVPTRACVKNKNTAKESATTPLCSIAQKSALLYAFSRFVYLTRFQPEE